MRIIGMMNSNIRERDRYLSILLVVHLSLMCCKNLFVSSTFVYKYNSLLNILCLIILCVMYLDYFVRLGGWKHLKKNVFVVLFAVFAFWLFSFCFDQNLFICDVHPYSYVRKNALLFLSYGLPLFLVSGSIEDFSYVKELIFKAADIIFYVVIVTFFISLTSYGLAQTASSSYSMSYGNNVLLCCAFMCFKYVYTRNFINIIKVLIMSVIIFVVASRGPLVSIVALLVYVLFLIDKKNNKEIIRNFCIIILLLCVCIFYENIINILIVIFDKFDLSSRTLILMTQGALLEHDSGRSWYHSTLIEAINESPFLGLGAFGGEKTVGLSHSFYLDIFGNFGYIGGTVYFCWLFYSMISLYRKKTNSVFVQFMMINALILFPRGFFDDNLWGVDTIWIIMGILINPKVNNFSES